MHKLICGNNLEVLPTIEDDSIDLVCTDPPFGWNFMGKNWDAALPHPQTWVECLRVLKPGSFAFVMAGARTDMLWRVMRDLDAAGFWLDLQPLFWTYFSGFPKSLNISKDLDKAAFISWCNSIPEGETRSRKELMGWDDAELRKAASAAVGGCYSGIDEKVNRNQYVQHGNDEDGYRREWMADKERHKGAELIAAIQERFGAADGIREKIGEKYRGGNALVPTSVKGGTYGVGVESIAGGNIAITAASTDLAKQYDGWHSAQLKPAVEVIIVAQKPFKGNIRDNVAAHGVGGYNIDACRIPYSSEDDKALAKPQGAATSKIGALAGGTQNDNERNEFDVIQKGRYPANLLVSDNLFGENTKYFDIDKWSKEHGFDEEWIQAAEIGFIQISKPSKSEKNAGCGELEEKDPACVTDFRPSLKDSPENWTNGTESPYMRTTPKKNNHATVKAVKLMSFLIHLACPPGGTVLDPFAGSGTTNVAAIIGGFNPIGIEMEESYCDIAEARCRWAEGNKPQPNNDLRLNL